VKAASCRLPVASPAIAHPPPTASQEQWTPAISRRHKLQVESEPIARQPPTDSITSAGSAQAGTECPYRRSRITHTRKKATRPAEPAQKQAQNT